MIKKLTALTLIVGALLISTGCSSTAETTPAPEPVVSTRYTAYGRYRPKIVLDDGTEIEGVITNDGHIWEYDADSISDRTPTDNMPVWVAFDDNGTPDNITDDIILGLVYDRNTAIYDQLEAALGESFEIERNENNIKIGGLKND